MTNQVVIDPDAREPDVYPENAVMLSTGKPHVSYSELTDWVQCPFRHKLVHILKVRPFLISPAMAFGKAMHSGCETYLKTGKLDIEKALGLVTADFAKNRYKPEYSRYSESNMNQLLEVGAAILLDVPHYLDTTFPGWKFIASEQYIYEPLENHPGNFFKGFIDAVIDVPHAKKGSLVWIIDFKTCQWGWPAKKKQDAMVRNQLVLYKSFWSKINHVELKTLRSGFVLLKKVANPGKYCDLIPVSVGDTTSGRALKMVDNMVFSLKKGISIKNKINCDRCEFKRTVHCP